MNFESIFLVIAGIVLIKKPEWMWKISRLVGNQNEHPQNLTVSIICVLGIILLVCGLLPIVRGILKYS